MLAVGIIGGVVIAALAGVVLLAVGLRGRRIYDHPICQRCRFDLVGIYPAQERCPECGSQLIRAKAVRHGARRKRKGLLCVAILLLLIGLGGGGVLVWSSATSYNWYAVSPDWLLEAVAGLDDQTTQGKAVGELAARLAAGTLDGERADRLIERGLEIQADQTQTWVRTWGDLIEAGLVADRLSREQFEGYIEWGIVCTLDIAERVRQGEDAMVRLHLSPERLGAGISITMTLTWPAVRTGEGDVLLPSGKGRQARFGFAGGQAGYGISAIPAMIELEPGQYSLTATPTLEVQVTRFAVPIVQEPVTVRHALRTSFEVVPPGTPLVDFVDDPSLQEQMEAGIGRFEIRAFAEGDDFTSLSLEVRGATLPMDFAFDALVVNSVGEPKFLLRSVIEAGGQRGWGSAGKLRFQLGETATLILRASEQAVLDSPDLGPVWGGEIVI